ncbi:class I ribonucleotide reductase maintenance protein YfaE [Vibrio sp. SCSIO 43136]|uniref:class I ribonucleotide reductase maintenance protein YfaE n=1 Tax=Vibrio sp. SCSIO 43136 TaxID=2819101 RepID=UPI0020754F9C|nr:class I ribonucleotide reductase maintenance protein YfaE [Vibrio sp. SCSIO 43136]USD66374.1 2Fe-2S iron-sulfur cluster binding domain-containing protein [Vibrio sp. SCSIO 43136]
MHSVKINKISAIKSQASQTLLEAMESAGMEVEYNCRDGHCGACRCNLDAGDVEYVGFAMAFVQPNEILPCICKAKSDVTLSNVNYQLKRERA